MLRNESFTMLADHLETYRTCVIEARKANAEGDHLEASYWLGEAMVSRIEYLYGPAPLSLSGFKAYVTDVLQGQLDLERVI